MRKRIIAGIMVVLLFAFFSALATGGKITLDSRGDTQKQIDRFETWYDALDLETQFEWDDFLVELISYKVQDKYEDGYIAGYEIGYQEGDAIDIIDDEQEEKAPTLLDKARNIFAIIALVGPYGALIIYMIYLYIKDRLNKKRARNGES